MKKNNKIVIGVLAFILVIGLISGVVWYSVSQTGVSIPSNVKLAVPHFASFKCDVVQDKVGLSYNIPSGGLLISQKSVGFYTNGVTNIKTNVDYGFWTSVISDLRLRYSVCDVNGNNCGEEKIVKYYAPGQRVDVYNSLDLTKYSMKIYAEQLTLLNLLSGTWTPYDKATISYDSKAFGLDLYSTTFDPAGKVVCSSSCDLSCPEQGVRDKLVFTDKNVLDFYSTSPYLEYWESLDYDLNSQGGASIYDAGKNEFCLATNIYSAKELKMENGVVYIYPDTATKKNVECCNGAVISTTLEDKYCENNVWKTISKDTKIRCVSDVNCPGQGQNTCQKLSLSSWSCSASDSLGKYCVESSGKTVACCVNSDCASDMVCQDNKCVGGNVIPPINPGLGNDTGLSCKSELFGLVSSEPGVKDECGFWCKIGFAKPTPVNTCVKDYTYLIISIILVIGVLAVLFWNKPKSPKSDNYNGMIIGGIVLVGVAALVYFYFFAYFFWALIVLGVLYGLYFFFIKK